MSYEQRRDVPFDPSAKVVSARFLPHNVAICLFIVNRHLIGKYSETLEVFYISVLLLHNK